jgi:hypothetical protein
MSPRWHHPDLEKVTAVRVARPRRRRRRTRERPPGGGDRRLRHARGGAGLQPEACRARRRSFVQHHLCGVRTVAIPGLRAVRLNQSARPRQMPDTAATAHGTEPPPNRSIARPSNGPAATPPRFAVRMAPVLAQRTPGATRFNQGSATGNTGALNSPAPASAYGARTGSDASARHAKTIGSRTRRLRAPPPHVARKRFSELPVVSLTRPDRHAGCRRGPGHATRHRASRLRGVHPLA